MGRMNFSKGGWTGSVGIHTGRTWKGIQVIATKAEPAYSRTEAQGTIRDAFGRFNRWTALFAPEIKYLTSLNTSKQSVRNAITQLNKAHMTDPEYPYEDMQINAGGRQKPIAPAATSADGIVTVTWTKPTSTVYSDQAKMIILVIDEDDAMVEVGQVEPTAETWTGTINMGTNTDIYVYCWLLDKVGSMRVGSKSVGIKIAKS